MKLYPHATPDGIIQTVELAELEKLRAELAQTKKHLAEANKGARVNAHINQSFAGKVNAWQAMAERLATALDDCNTKLAGWHGLYSSQVGADDEAAFQSGDKALAAYESAKSCNLPDPPLFEYSGKMYMRPCDRGAVLCDIDKQFDNDVLPEGDYKCSIRVWKGGQSCPDCQPAKAGNETDFVTKDPLSEAVKRMEAVPVGELVTAYCDGPGTGGIGAACCQVRARLISAAKGEQP